MLDILIFKSVLRFVKREIMGLKYRALFFYILMNYGEKISKEIFIERKEQKININIKF